MVLATFVLECDYDPKARFPFEDNFKRAEFFAGFMQSDWLLKQQSFERTKMSGKKVGKYSTFRWKIFARLKSSSNGKRA